MRIAWVVTARKLMSGGAVFHADSWTPGLQLPSGIELRPDVIPNDDSRAQSGYDSPGKKSLIPTTSQLPGGRQQTRVVLFRGNRPGVKFQ